MKNEPLEKRISELEARVEALEKVLSPSSEQPLSSTPKGKIMSPKEFLITREPSGEVETTFALCFYAEQVMRMEFFNINDIEKLFQAAKVPVPKNLNDKINKNIQKGLLTDAAEKKTGKKAWVVTMRGENVFNEANKKNNQ
jgi:hypothetical protein